MQLVQMIAQMIALTEQQRHLLDAAREDSERTVIGSIAYGSLELELSELERKLSAVQSVVTDFWAA